MPCFDKKLEASRSDFYMSEAETREVDCVITSGAAADRTNACRVHESLLVFIFLPVAGEVQKMLEEEHVSLADVEPAALDTLYVLCILPSLFTSPFT